MPRTIAPRLCLSLILFIYVEMSHGREITTKTKSSPGKTIRTDEHASAFELFTFEKKCSLVCRKRAMERLKVYCTNVSLLPQMGILQARCDLFSSITPHEVAQAALHNIAGIRRQIDNLKLPSPSEGESINTSSISTDPVSHLNNLNNIKGSRSMVEMKASMPWGLDSTYQRSTSL